MRCGLAGSSIPASVSLRLRWLLVAVGSLACHRCSMVCCESVPSVDGGEVLPIVVGIECGECPRDAWVLVQILDDCVQVVEAGCFADCEIDFSPAWEWASACSASSVPRPPPGWRFEVVV